MDEHEIEEQQDRIDLNEVMQAFGVINWNNLGPVASPSPYPQLLNLQIEIEGQRFILKERAEGPAEEDTSHRYHFQHYLREAGIPIPPLWLTPQGEPVVTIGEDSFELQQWVDGELFSSADSRTLDWVADAGEMLALLHQASRHYPGHQHRWPSEVQAGGLVQGWLNLVRSKVELSEVHAIAAALSNIIDAWETVLPATMMAIGAVRGLPEFHIHGDYNALNLRFDSQGVSAVLGLDASRWEKRIIELAYGLFYFCALEWRTDRSLNRPLMKRGFEPERVSRFLRAYGAVYPPGPGEAPLLVDALTLIAPIVTINGPLEDIFFPSEHEEVLIDDVMERLAWTASLPAWLARVRRSFAEMWA